MAKIPPLYNILTDYQFYHVKQLLFFGFIIVCTNFRNYILSPNSFKTNAYVAMFTWIFTYLFTDFKN
jgi:hypothetical protein